MRNNLSSYTCSALFNLFSARPRNGLFHPIAWEGSFSRASGAVKEAAA